MKKILFSFFIALVVITTAKAQDEKTSATEIKLEYVTEKTDNSMGAIIPEKHFQGTAMIMSGKIAGVAEMNVFGKKTFGFGIGYGHPAYEDELVSFAIMAKADIVSNQDPQKSKQILVGGMAYIKAKAEDSWEATGSLSVTTKLKNSSGEWNQTRLRFNAEGQKFLGSTFGIGVHLEYRTTMWNEVYNPDPNIQFRGYRSANGRLHIGPFVAARFSKFEACLGMDMQRTMNSWQQNDMNNGIKQFNNSNFYAGAYAGIKVNF